MVKRDIRFQGEGRSRRPFKLKGMTRDREKEREKKNLFVAKIREQKRQRGRTSREWMTGGDSSRKDDKLRGWMNESFKQNVRKERRQTNFSEGKTRKKRRKREKN